MSLDPDCEACSLLELLLASDFDPEDGALKAQVESTLITENAFTVVSFKLFAKGVVTAINLFHDFYQENKEKTKEGETLCH